MPGKFNWLKFKDIDLENEFFDPLKNDYEEFTDWFIKKAKNNEEALVYIDRIGIGAFLYLKNENEQITLKEKILPACERIKIGTLRLSERQRGLRIGEGAIGVALWKWQESTAKQIYVTVFNKHDLLINLFIKYGFCYVGKNKRGECVYIKDKENINYTNVYTSFPFINSNFKKAGLVPIEDIYHDKLFPYSELMRNNKELEEITAGNGITKIFIGTPYSSTEYETGEPVGIYRIYTEIGQKTYRSVLTSYCTISEVIHIKCGGSYIKTYDEYINIAGNKTVFNEEELKNIYYTKRKNVIMLVLIYNGFFGKGHNITHNELNNLGLFNSHPYNIIYSNDDFIKILKMGDVNVQNVIIN